MALADQVRTVIDDLASQDEVSIRDLMKQLKNAIAIARASGLSVAEYTLPTGISRRIEIESATASLKALSELLGLDGESVVFQRAEFRWP